MSHDDIVLAIRDAARRWGAAHPHGLSYTVPVPRAVLVLGDLMSRLTRCGLTGAVTLLAQDYRDGTASAADAHGEEA